MKHIHTLEPFWKYTKHGVKMVEILLLLRKKKNKNIPITYLFDILHTFTTNLVYNNIFRSNDNLWKRSRCI